MSSKPTEIEKENLESHVELCALRYGELERRLTSIESKVSTLATTIEKSHLSTIKVLIGTAGTVIAGIISIVIVLLMKAG
jgi:hypothetical protein